ncbi:LacI family DNA-binding transcriptional regulator [Brachybacterium sp. GCM10030252]|uniref:LacI family DNA-binding transcriptional regulator n=1 Tax=Brachybacterium sp. GCM10030252 TaxID=3273380 RepID=UPI00360EC1C2
MSPTPPDRPRLVDVAELAGVSMKTVSNVINGYAYVSEDTRDRVLTAIERTGYRPNLSARSLARGRSGFIALVVPRLDMPYFAVLAARVISAAEALGWFVLIHQTDGDSRAERDALEGQFPQRVDGLIVSLHSLGAEDVARRRSSIPLVALGDRGLGPDVPHVGIDNIGAGKLAVRHLVESGCRRIAMIGSGMTHRNLRAQGFFEGLLDAELALLPELMRPIAGNSGEEGERATTELLAEIDEPPDGIFAVTDWVAFGAMRALDHHGLRVPDDVCVIGFDDIPYSPSFNPSLTTIAPDREAIASRAVDLLADQIDGGSRSKAIREQAEFRLVVRESTQRTAR